MSTEALTYVTLVSIDGFRYILPREAAEGSGFLKDALSDDSGFTEGRTGVVTLDYGNEIVEKVCEYLMYKHRWTGAKEDPPDFQRRVPPEIALELLMASDFLDC